MDRENILKSIKITIFSLFTIILIILVIFQTRKVATGPEISITYPKDGDIFIVRPIEISGNIKNATETTMNERPIFIDESGNFKDILILADGVNYINISGKDRFGKENSKRIAVTYNSTSSNIINYKDILSDKKVLKK